MVRTPCTLPLAPPLHQAMFVRGRHTYSRRDPSAFFVVIILFKTQPNFPKGSKKGGQVSLAHTKTVTQLLLNSLSEKGRQNTAMLIVLREN